MSLDLGEIENCISNILSNDVHNFATYPINYNIIQLYYNTSQICKTAVLFNVQLCIMSTIYAIYDAVWHKNILLEIKDYC